MIRLDPVHARAALRGIVAADLDDDALIDRAARAAWSGVAEPGDGVAGALVARMGAARALGIAGAGDARAVAAAAEAHERSAREAIERWAPRLASPSLDEHLERARRAGALLLTPADEAWPSALDDLGAHAPLCLWVRGRVTLLDRPGLAVVGARAATAYGEHVAMELASDVAADGVTIVSGAAYGIDGAAHRAALSAGGTTVALLAGGVDRPYPAGHSDLLERIARTGAVVAEVPCGASPTKWRFLARNRLIAALAQATIVVEAGWRSGSLNTAGHAAALGRALGAVPGPVTSAASAGCHRLLRDYDARCITGPADARELLGYGDDVPEMAGEWTDDVVRVRDALSTRSWRAAVEIARRSGLGVADVEARLGVLALEGAVDRSADSWRLRASRAT